MTPDPTTEDLMETNASSSIDGVKDVLVETLGLEDRAGAIAVDTPLLGALPELDSLAVAELIVALENHYDISFDEDDVTAEAFADLASLAALVDEKLS